MGSIFTFKNDTGQHVRRRGLCVGPIVWEPKEFPVKLVNFTSDTVLIAVCNSFHLAIFIMP
jgi:hypothetical protein